MEFKILIRVQHFEWRKAILADSKWKDFKTVNQRRVVEGQQMAAEMLAAAGANYYMDVCLNTDRMLAYFDTSAHDDQTLREIYSKNPAPEFLEWALAKGIMRKSEDGSVLR